MVPKLCQMMNMSTQKSQVDQFFVPIVRCLSVSVTYSAEEYNARTHKYAKLEG